MTETAAPAMQETLIDGVTKYTIAYPLTDESGQPLLDRNGKPRFTNLVADTIEELISKQAQQNIEVARALERSSRRFETLSSRQPTPKAAPVEIKGKPLTDEEKVQVGLDSQDPRKAADAIKRVVESVVPVAEITGEVKRQAATLDIESRKRIAREFISSHAEYFPIDANNAFLNKYLAEHNLEFSVANLEYAFATLAPKLAERPRSANPPENAAPPSPDNAPPDNEPPNRETPPAQTRRAPTSGISNSQVSAGPTGKTLPYTKDQLLKMAMAHDPKYEALIRDPVKYAMVNAILAGR